ncbi:MAG: EamA family transporter [Planctomycetia bacterium]|nr:EamA family transporter [Planctomycetia bacterium]
MSNSNYTWIWLAVLAAVFATLVNLFAKMGVTDAGGMKIDKNLATAIRTSAAFILAWGLFVGWSLAHAQPMMLKFQNLTAINWLFLILTGVCTGMTWLCTMYALALGEVSRVAPLSKLSVIFLIPIGIFVLGETVTVSKIAGGVLILLGSLLIML